MVYQYVNKQAKEEGGRKYEYRNLQECLDNKVGTRDVVT